MCGFFMSYLKVRGKNTLHGKITIQGSKNSCLPMLAASVLAQDTVIIRNCPNISDVKAMLQILSELGCRWKMCENILVVDNSEIRYDVLSKKCQKLRASMTLIGAMLSRFGKVVAPCPGGCNLGGRPIDFHIEGLRMLGVDFKQQQDYLYAKVNDNECVGEYSFPKPSLGAAQNLILRALSINGKSVFNNCTKEPELVDFCEFLSAMGAKIYGAGTDRIVVEGGHKLSGCDYTLNGDRIVAGTYMAAVSVTNGNILLSGIDGKRLRTEIDYLRKIGCHIFTDSTTNEIIVISCGRKKSEPDIITGPYPEFATDLQSQMLAASCFYNGTTSIADSIYPMRFAVTKELRKFGANIIMDHGVAVVCGSESMCGAIVKASDLRAGAALVIASLGADGESLIYGTEHILRGYEDIQRDLRALGADIEWAEDEEERSRDLSE